MPHDINSQQSFDVLPQKLNSQRKNMGAHDRIPPNPAISRHESPNGVRQRSLPKHATATRSIKIDIRQIFDCYRWRGDDGVNDRPVGKSQEEGMMNIATSFSLSKKPRFNRSSRKKPILLKVMLASFATALDNLWGASSKL
jgi:hypothetical protein